MNRASGAYRAGALREMGLGPIWRLRGAETAASETVADEASAPEVVADAGAVAQPARVESPHARGGAPSSAAASRPPAFTPSERATPDPGHPGRAAVSDPDPGRTARIAGLDWPELEADVRACRACRLCERRRQAVPGVGDRQADWLLVGEGPGAEEDARGEPFVGAAGRLLDNMLAAIGLKRGEDVYIANAVKCRPPHNRTPEVDEIAACFPYLERQIELIRPRLIVVLGRPAAQALLDGEVRIGAARGKVFHFRDIPLVVTYHPAYLLRNQHDKAKAWEDLCFSRRLMEELRGGA